MVSHWAKIDPTLKSKALKRLVLPLVRLCVRSSCSLQDLVEILKQGFVEVAAEDLGAQQLKPNVSRLSAVTGIRRPEIRRLLKMNEEDVSPSKNLLARVIAQWQFDPHFSEKPGVPRILTFKGRSAEFKRLCERVSTTLNPGTVQFEFERRKFVQRVDDSLELIYKVVPLDQEPLEAFDLVAKDIDGLIRSTEENILAPQHITNLHIHTEFDNIVPRNLTTIRQWLIEEGKDFHSRARAFIAQFDKDLNPDLTTAQGGGKVCLSAFSVTEARSTEEDT